VAQVSDEQVPAPGQRTFTRADDVIDLRDLSPATTETCNALALSLREGDLEAAERLFGFLGQMQPDRRLLLSELVQPMLRDELARMTRDPQQQAAFVSAARDLFMRRRSPMVDVSRDGVLLCGRRDDPDVLSLHMVSLLLDEVGIPAQVHETADADGIERLARDGLRRALCLTMSLAWDYADLVQAMRRRHVAVMVVGERVQDEPNMLPMLEAPEASWRVSEIAGTLMYVRGPLTACEAQVLKLVADGHTNVHIAHELDISVSAVKARLEGVFTKLSAADRAHAVAIALRRHWIR